MRTATCGGEEDGRPAATSQEPIASPCKKPRRENVDTGDGHLSTKARRSAPSGEATNRATHNVVIDLSNRVVNPGACVHGIERLEPKRHDSLSVERVVPQHVEDGEHPNVPAGEVAFDANDGERGRRLAVDGSQSALNDLEVLLLEPEGRLPVSLTGKSGQEDESEQRDRKGNDGVNDEEPVREAK
jgi:hypothetical protein